MHNIAHTYRWWSAPAAARTRRPCCPRLGRRWQCVALVPQGCRPDPSVRGPWPGSPPPHTAPPGRTGWPQRTRGRNTNPTTMTSREKINIKYIHNSHTYIIFFPTNKKYNFTFPERDTEMSPRNITIYTFRLVLSMEPGQKYYSMSYAIHYIYIHVHTYIHYITCIHTSTHTYIYAYTHTYLHTYIHTYIYTHTHIYICMHTYTQLHKLTVLSSNHRHD